MSEQLDYEATKAALRAQATASPRTAHRWRWTGTTGLVMVVCVVAATLWITRESPRPEVVMVPSAGHDAAGPATGSGPADEPNETPSAPRPTDIASVSLDGPTPPPAPERAATELAADDVSPNAAAPPEPERARVADPVIAPAPRSPTAPGRADSSPRGAIRSTPGRATNTPATPPSIGPSATTEPPATATPPAGATPDGPGTNGPADGGTGSQGSGT